MQKNRAFRVFSGFFRIFSVDESHIRQSENSAKNWSLVTEASKKCKKMKKTRLI